MCVHDGGSTNPNASHGSPPSMNPSPSLTWVWVSRLEWALVDEEFTSPTFGGGSSGGALVPSATVADTGKLRVTNVVDAVEIESSLLTVRAGRVSTLGATGTRATALNDADTATVAAGEGALFAVALYQPTFEGHTWRKARWEGHTWRR